MGIIISFISVFLTVLAYVYKVRMNDKKEIDKELIEVRTYIDKELYHLKELHNNKLEEVKKEIHQLRDELRESTVKQFELLNKLIDKR